MAATRLPVVQPADSAAEGLAPPLFPRIGIVGLGLIGGSIALAVRKHWPASLIVGVDRKSVLERAIPMHAIDVGADDPVVLKEVDLIVLAAPVEQNMTVVGTLGDHVAAEAIVTDTGSTKRAMVEAARALPPRLTFVGGHPLGGAAVSGIEFARADLFEGRPWLLTPSADTPAAAVTRVRELVSGLGAVPQTTTAEEHDRLLAVVSHLPQVAASALMHVVGERAGTAGLALSGRGLRDTTRLASSPPAIWRDVAHTNADHLAEAIDALVTALLEMKLDLRDGEVLERLFESAREWRSRLPDRDHIVGDGSSLDAGGSSRPPGGQ